MIDYLILIVLGEKCQNFYNIDNKFKYTKS